MEEVKVKKLEEGNEKRLERGCGCDATGVSGKKPKKLVLNEETLKRLTVRSGLRAGVEEMPVSTACPP